jgi:hypothetical protein
MGRKRRWAAGREQAGGLKERRGGREMRFCFFSKSFQNSFSTFQTFKFKLFSKFKHFKPFSKFSKQFKNF